MIINWFILLYKALVDIWSLIFPFLCLSFAFLTSFSFSLSYLFFSLPLCLSSFSFLEGPHIDSIKFSGDMICGLSLLSGRWMILTKDSSSSISNLPADSHPYFPSEKKIWLPPRSLYIQTGIWRYEYAHAISLPDVEYERRLVLEINERKEKENGSLHHGSSASKGNHRRISILFRNPLSSDIH
jgi:hypothetical protein